MKNRSIRARRFAPVLSLLSLAMSASVQSQVAALNPVVVSATRVEQKLSDVIPSATVITREDIERSQAPTLVDLIQGQPGVEIGRNGGPGTLSSIFMRGQNSNNVAVFMDGVRVQTDAIGSLKLVDIPPSQIEKIEILRGNMGAVYGESAVGGIINIYTRSGSVGSGPTASMSYGSRNTTDLAAGYNHSGEDFKLALSLQRFDTDGYSAMNPNQGVGVNPDKDGFKRESVFVSGEKKINKDWALGFQANNIVSDVDYDKTGGATNIQKSKQKSDDLTVYSRFSLSTEWNSRLALTQSTFENRDFQNGLLNGSFIGDQLSMQWSNDYRIGQGRVLFGADTSNANFKTPTEYDRNSRGYYAGYSGLYDKLDYQVNLRHDQVDAKSASSSIDKSANTWLLGLGYALTDSFKLTGLVSTAFRAPNTAELFDVPAWFTRGNPNLEPEEHKGQEIGASYATALGNFRLVRFESKTTNAIAYQSGTYENIGKASNKGFEFSIDGYADGWGYKFSAVTQDPKDSKTGARLTRRAKEYGSVELTKMAWGVDLGAKLIWSGNRADSHVQTFKPIENNSYTVVNLTASKKLSQEWTGRLKVENAFDKKYQFAHGYDAVPRGVFVTLQYQPK